MKICFFSQLAIIIIFEKKLIGSTIIEIHTNVIAVQLSSLAKGYDPRPPLQTLAALS
jgi:hypothetical protein